MTTCKQDQNVPADAAGFISAVLGKGVNLAKPANVLTALNKSFAVKKDANGKSFVDFEPAPFVSLAGDAATLTGEPLGRLQRATTFAAEIRKAVANIQPLREDDCDNAGTLRDLLLASVDEVVNQLGSPEGPLVPVVESLGNDIVPRQYAALKTGFGFDDACINDVAQELVHTELANVGNYIDLLIEICTDVKKEAAGKKAISLGTQSMAVEHKLMCITEAVQQFLDSLEEAGIDPRCTTVNVQDGATATIGQFVDNIRDFVQGRGPSLIASTDGYELALAPTLAVFAKAADYLRNYNKKVFVDEMVTRSFDTLQAELSCASQLAGAVKRPKRSITYVTKSVPATPVHKGYIPIEGKGRSAHTRAGAVHASPKRAEG